MNFKNLVILLAVFLGVKTVKGQTWPVLKHYDENHISKVALPIGGIGTGTVSLNGRGSLVDWGL